MDGKEISMRLDATIVRRSCASSKVKYVVGLPKKSTPSVLAVGAGSTSSEKFLKI